MQVCEPQTKKEARKYVGRKVTKAFTPVGGKRQKDFSGTVIEVYLLNKEMNYKIKYEDGDVEDIAWEELTRILVVDESAPGPGMSFASGGGLADATNRQLTASHGMKLDEAPASKRLRTAAATCTATENANGSSGLTTPAAAAVDGLEPSGQGTQRRGRVRGDDLQAGDEHGGGLAKGPPGTLRSRRGVPRQEAAEEVEQQPTQQEEEAAVAGPSRRTAAASRGGGIDMGGPEALVMEDEPMVFVAREGEGSAGHVARVHLENFMCHEHFEVDMGNHVTLISGQNGSGKSAIMQALMLCLGLTARETGRGTNATGFIRTGAHDSKLQVTLWNTGPEAFRPDLFGSRITVERVLRRTGASSYALLDARMRKVHFEKGQNVRDVLNQLLDHFAIDAGNPLVVITQDLARDFLQSGKDDTKLKYNMFVEGTLLQKTQESLKESNMYVTQQAQNLARCAKDLNAERQKQNELKQQLETIRSADTLVEARDVYEKAVVWRAAQHMEEHLRAASTAAQARGPELVELHDRFLEALAAAERELQERKRDLEEEVKKQAEIINNHSEHVKALLRVEKESRTNRERAQRQMCTAQTALEQLNRDKAELDQRLEKETSGKAAEARRLVEEHQQRMTAKNAEVQQATEAVTAAQQALEAARIEVDKLMKDEQGIRQNKLHAQQLVGNVQASLQQVAAAQGNRLVLFHAAQLDLLIQQHLRSFRQRPIGPIGALLTVTDRKWLLTAEVALGSSFRDYLVGCPEDEALLRNLMHQAGYTRASIVRTSFAAPPHPVPDARRPANGFAALLDVLRVQEPAVVAPVLNYLIDRHKVEGTALVDNNVQGRSVMYQAAAGPHIAVAMDPEGNWYRRNGGMQWVERNTSKRADQARLVADMSQYLASLRNDLERYQAEMGAYEEDAIALGQKLEEARARVMECHQKTQAAQIHKQRLATELTRLGAAAPEMPRMEDDEETGIVLTQLASLQGEMAASQVDLQNAQETLRIAAQAHAQAMEQMNAEKARYQEQVESGGKARHAVAEVDAELATLAGCKSTAESKRQRLGMHLDRLLRETAAAEAQLQQALAAAEQVCSREEGEQALSQAEVLVRQAVAKKLERQRRTQQGAGRDESAQQELLEKTVKSTMKYDGLELFRDKNNKDIAKLMADAGCKDKDPEDLERELEAVNRKMAAALNRYRRAERLVAHFQAIHDKQVRNFETLRANTERITQAKFRKYMLRRDHVGKLVWDHAERTLRVFVKPRGRLDPNVQPVEDLKQLSGGERSYTTISLLLAVGASTESPFRCMDEYDVYMDPINRRVATETLLEFAYENSGYQYIFLTPQDIQAVRDARENVIRRCKVQLPPAFLKTVPIRPARPNAA